jgi:hypothetical protein
VAKIPILSQPSTENTGGTIPTVVAEMPLVYMGDFSVMGLVVSECARAIEVLQENAVSVTTGPTGSDVHFGDAATLNAIVQLLRKHAIECHISDIVRHVYQG